MRPPTIEDATRDFISDTARRNPGRPWSSYVEWVDGDRVLEFDVAIIEAREGWFVLARFGGGPDITRTGPVGGLATADAIVSELRKAQAAAVGSAIAALRAELESFEYPDWPIVNGDT